MQHATYTVTDTMREVPYEYVRFVSSCVFLQEDATRRYMIQEDDETFHKYADVCIDEWRRQGKDTKPMELYMNTLDRYGNSVTRLV